MSSERIMPGFKRNAVIPDFHNGGIIRTDQDGSVVSNEDVSGNSDQELVEMRGMEGAQADELAWRSGQGN